MAIYKDGVRYVVYYNGNRYVDSLTKPKCPNVDSFFRIYDSHSTIDQGSVALTAPFTNSYSVWYRKLGEANWINWGIVGTSSTIINYEASNAVGVDLKLTENGFYDSETYHTISTSWIQTPSFIRDATLCTTGLHSGFLTVNSYYTFSKFAVIVYAQTYCIKSGNQTDYKSSGAGTFCNSSGPIYIDLRSGDLINATYYSYYLTGDPYTFCGYTITPLPTTKTIYPMQACLLTFNTTASNDGSNTDCTAEYYDIGTECCATTTLITLSATNDFGGVSVTVTNSLSNSSSVTYTSPTSSLTIEAKSGWTSPGTHIRVVCTHAPGPVQGNVRINAVPSTLCSATGKYIENHMFQVYNKTF